MATLVWSDLERQGKRLAAAWGRVFSTVFFVGEVYIEQDESLTELLGLSAYM